MERRALVMGAVLSGMAVASPFAGAAQSHKAATPEAEGEPTAGPVTGYAPVNGLEMYHEIHGDGGVPLVLLHGAFSTIDLDFGQLLPALAATRQVIAVELQGHGRTGDIDRPLSYAGMAGDVVGLLEHLGITQADILGYSAGAGVALEVGLQRPDLVRKLVLATPFFQWEEALYPEMVAGLEQMTPSMLYGSPFHAAYLELSPDPEHFDDFFAKKQAMDRAFTGWSEATVRSIEAPALLITGDADIFRPEHVVEMFRLFDGGVPGDVAGLPASRLAILPGTTHISLVNRGTWVAEMVTEFLDAPLP